MVCRFLQHCSREFDRVLRNSTDRSRRSPLTTNPIGVSMYRKIGSEQESEAGLSGGPAMGGLRGRRRPRACPTSSHPPGLGAVGQVWHALEEFRIVDRKST